MCRFRLNLLAFILDSGRSRYHFCRSPERTEFNRYHRTRFHFILSFNHCRGETTKKFDTNPRVSGYRPLKLACRRLQPREGLGYYFMAMLAGRLNHVLPLGRISSIRRLAVYYESKHNILWSRFYLLTSNFSSLHSRLYFVVSRKFPSRKSQFYKSDMWCSTCDQQLAVG